MLHISTETWTAFNRRMELWGVTEVHRPHYRRLVGFYLEFCDKYGHTARSGDSLEPFLEKLNAKGQSAAQREEAARAVGLLLAKRRRGRAGKLEARATKGAGGAGKLEVRATKEAGEAGKLEARATKEAGEASKLEAWSTREAGGDGKLEACPTTETRGKGVPSSPVSSQERLEGSGMARPRATAGAGRAGSGRRSDEAGALAAEVGCNWEKEYRALQGSITMRNYSPRTFEAYRGWVRKFQSFLRSPSPDSLTGKEVKAFLTDLAVREGVAASTQNQAFNALLYFYRHVLGREFGKLTGVARANRRVDVPVVLSKAEVKAVLSRLEPPYDLMTTLLSGCGLRISECLELRVHCFNLESMLVTVHDGKGQKDRTVPLPKALKEDIEDRMELVRAQHREDLADHAHAPHVQAAIRRAARAAGIPKRVSRTLFGIRLRVTCCWPDMICRQSSVCWGTVMRRRR